MSEDLIAVISFSVTVPVTLLMFYLIIQRFSRIPLQHRHDMTALQKAVEEQWERMKRAMILGTSPCEVYVKVSSPQGTTHIKGTAMKVVAPEVTEYYGLSPTNKLQDLQLNFLGASWEINSGFAEFMEVLDEMNLRERKIQHNAGLLAELG